MRCGAGVLVILACSSVLAGPKGPSAQIKLQPREAVTVVAGEKTKAVQSIINLDTVDLIVRTEGTPALLSGSGARDARLRQIDDVVSAVVALENSLLASKKLGEKQTVDIVGRRFTQVFCGFRAHVHRETMKRIPGLPGVTGVWIDRKVTASLNQSVPLIRANRVWNELGFDGTGVRVAVVDTGIDYTHPDLGGCLGASCKVVTGYDFVNDDPNPTDDNGHGTHVAGIVGANGVIKGVAPGSRLLAYKVLDATGNGFMSDVVAGIERATDDAADVINVSFGGEGDPDDPASQAVDAAFAAGVIVVVAVGNDGPGYETLPSPGCARKALTVGASTKADQIAEFSSRGTVQATYQIKPELVAPGVAITSTVPHGTCELCDPSGYLAMDGTSMASPHVAGAAALLVQQHPSWTPQQVRDALMQRSVDLGYAATTQGSGRIDAYAAATPAALASPAMVSLGQDNPGLSSFSRNEPMSLTSLRQSPTTFTLSVDGVFPPGMSVTVSPPSFVVAAGATKPFTLAVTVDNPVVPSLTTAPWTYEGSVRIVGAGQTLDLPFALVKAPALTLSLDEDPWTVIVHDRGNFSHFRGLPGPVWKVLVPEGTFDISVVYQDAVTYVVRENVYVHGNLAVTMNKAEAVHPLQIVPTDRNGAPLTLTRGLAMSVFSPTTFNYTQYVTSGTNEAPAPSTFNFSPLADTYVFDVAVYEDPHAPQDPMYQFNGYMRGAINGPKTFQYTPAGFKHVVKRHTPDPGTTRIADLTYFYSRPDPPFFLFGVALDCDGSTRLAPFEEEAYLDPLPFPDFGVGYMQEHVFGVGADYCNDWDYQYSTPYLAATSSSVLRGYRDWVREPAVFETTGTVLRSGIGPYSSFGAFSNAPNAITFYSAFGGPQALFLGGAGDMHETADMPYELYSNGSPLQAGTIPASNGLTLFTPSGPYELRIAKDGSSMAGHAVRSRVRATFDTSSGNANPPYLTAFRMESGGTLVDQFPPGGGSIRFKVLDDFEVSRIALSYDPGTGYRPLPIEPIGMDEYAAIVPPLSGAPAVVPLSLSVGDPTGNVMTWSLCSPDSAKPEVCDGFDNDCDGLVPAGELTDVDHDATSVCGGDCNDGNAQIWHAPTETPSLSLVKTAPTGSATLNWHAPYDGGTSAATTYDVLRSATPSVFTGAQTLCLETNNGPDTAATDTANPTAGAAFYYQIRARNACPSGSGSLGARSDGTPRTGRSCP